MNKWVNIDNVKSILRIIIKLALEEANEKWCKVDDYIIQGFDRTMDSLAVEVEEGAIEKLCNRVEYHHAKFEDKYGYKSDIEKARSELASLQSKIAE